MNTKTKTAIEALRLEVLRCGVRRDDIGVVEERDGRFEFAVRYFGDWMVPEDEEDDGDYDWKVPTPSSRRMLDKLVDTFSKKFGVKLVWENEGEKCWLRFATA